MNNEEGWDGVDRRSHAEEFGYIKAKVEENSTDIKEIKESFKEHMKQEVETSREISQTLKDLEKQLDMYRTVVWTVKALGATVALLLAFKFGDIASLWKGD